MISVITKKNFLKLPATLLVTHTPPRSRLPSPKPHTLTPAPTIPPRGDEPACTTTGQAGWDRLVSFVL